MFSIPLRTLAVSALVACATLASVQFASAQDASVQGPSTAGTTPPIQQQMSPEEFKAAGLDKLAPDELARLNAWLGRTIGAETAKAAKIARKKVEDDNRGFFNFGSKEPIKAHVAGRFDGFQSGRTYTLDNGQVWKQTDTSSLVGVHKDNIEVTIKPAMIGNAWYMQVKGYATAAKVERVK